ncbi:hypothetical protein HID58_003148, partial [Brassica napus]
IQFAFSSLLVYLSQDLETLLEREKRVANLGLTDLAIHESGAKPLTPMRSLRGARSLPHLRQSIVCLNCPSVAHLACPPPPPPPSSSFTCPPCSDPNFSFFPKSNPDQESADALVAAAKISAALMNNEAAELKKEAHKKIFAAKEAKMRAKEALGNLQDLVLKQKASEKKNSNNANPNPNKRKHR